ncbi:MAG: hypothetical protein JW940_21255 [Polyangiaceae bacterium]|nr:hypothetical protein [Polyangiaceae bacterium]
MMTTAALVGCFEQKTEVITTSGRRPKPSPPVAVTGSIAVERSGELELCVDGALPPVDAKQVPNARKLLGERLARAASSGEPADKSCKRRYQLRPELAACSANETMVVDGANLTLSVVTRYYRIGASERGSAAERECTKAQGKWASADPTEPGVAAERFRQGASRVLGGVNQHVVKEVDRVARPR